MASTSSKNPSNVEFTGQAVCIHTTNEDIQSPGHQARVESWIQDFEKSKQVFVFPVKPVRIFSGLILALGLSSALFHVASSSLRRAFVSSLLGSGIWIATFCIATGVLGLVAAQKRSNTLLMNYNVMALIATTLAAITLVLNSIGMEMFTKLCCPGKMLPSLRKLGDDLDSLSLNSTNVSTDEPQRGDIPLTERCIGPCEQSSLILMAIILLHHICLFLVSAYCSAYVFRILHSSFAARSPPLVIYHSDTSEKTGKMGPSSTSSKEGVRSERVEKLMEKLHEKEPEQKTGTSYTTPAAVA